MDFIGIDLHKTSSQICLLSGDGELTERRIKSTRASFDEVFAGRPVARILVEASTESEWVACHLEGLGHEVIVADPNFAPMYATRDKKIKADKRDARALCEACRLGAYRPAHRTSERQRRIRVQLLVRSTLVRTRSKYIPLVGALARREGCRIASGGSNNFIARVEADGLPEHVMRPSPRSSRACGCSTGRSPRLTPNWRRSSKRMKSSGDSARHRESGRLRPGPSPLPLMTPPGSGRPSRCAPISGWYRASTARASASTEAASARWAGAAHGRC